jgi:hypothetical protein
MGLSVIYLIKLITNQTMWPQIDGNEEWIRNGKTVREGSGGLFRDITANLP